MRGARRAVVVSLALVASLGAEGCFETEPPEPSVSSGGTSDEGGAGGEGGVSVPSGGTGGSAGEMGIAGDFGGLGGMEPAPRLDCSASYADPEALMRPSSALHEVSGIAVGRRADLLFALNDSGNAPAIYAMSLRGELVSVWMAEAETSASDSSPEMSLVDWEDLASTVSSAGAAQLVVADTGDNERMRSSVVLYVLSEPELESGEPLTAWQRLELTYPDGPRDAETLLTVPGTSQFVLVTKELPPVVYSGEFPRSPGTFELSLERQGALEQLPDGFFPTGGAVSFAGDALVVRSRQQLLMFPRRAEQSLVEALWNEPCELPLASEAQGEAVSFDAEGNYFTLGEGPSVLQFYELTSSEFSPGQNQAEGPLLPDG